MLLAGVVMKLGASRLFASGYRFVAAGAQEWATCIAIFAIINIVYGAFVALKQDDFKFVIQLLQRQPHGLRAAGWRR